MTARLLANVTCVAIEGRGLLIEGAPGSGKSSLALALIDRGATLVGDDGIALAPRCERIWALPPPEIAGVLEIRGVGLVELPATEAPLCLVLALEGDADRLPETGSVTIAGTRLPRLALRAGPDAAIRAEWAMRLHGLAADAPGG